MARFSVLNLTKNAISEHRKWAAQWRAPELKSDYDIILVGAGGHGLATAWHLARVYGLTNIAVFEAGWLGGGNIARNTVTIRSNYMRDDSIPFYVKSVELFDRLTKDLNFNTMHSKRGMVDVLQTWAMVRDRRRRRLTMDLHGARYRPLSVQDLRRMVPKLTGGGPDARMPILGAEFHPDAAVNRHDAVAWGYARAIDAMGVEIHQNTPVTAITRGADGAVTGVETPRGFVRAGKVALAVSGHTTTLSETAGLRLPLRTINLSAFVSEPLQPCIDVVVNCPDLGVYLSQSDKGELVIGGATDLGQSFRRDVKQHVFEDTVAAMLDLFPSFRSVKLLRQWGGHLDIAHDASPIISTTDVPGLFVSAGWWGGYKAIPAGGLCLAHLLATGSPHPLATPFGLGRFRHLEYVLEAGTTTAR